MPRRSASATAASPEYLSALGLRLTGGRWFESSDYGEGRTAIVINETMAKQFWPGESAIGKCIVPGGFSTCIQIVGVVADTRTKDLRGVAKPQLYMSDLGDPRLNFLPRTLIVRVGNSKVLLPAIRRAILSSEPNLPYVEVQPLDNLVNPAFRSWDLGATIFSLFGVLALLLSVIGLYGSLSSAIDERKQEIAVRIALGATPAAIWSLTTRRIALLIAAGVGAGILALRWATPGLQPLLFGVQSSNGLVLSVALGTMLISAGIACYPPLARAGRVDPLDALRST